MSRPKEVLPPLRKFTGEETYAWGARHALLECGHAVYAMHVEGRKAKRCDDCARGAPTLEQVRLKGIEDDKARAEKYAQEARIKQERERKRERAIELAREMTTTAQVYGPDALGVVELGKLVLELLGGES